MSNLKVGVTTDKFDSGTVELEAPKEVKTVKLVINDDVVYSLTLPSGTHSKNLEIHALIRGGT